VALDITEASRGEPALSLIVGLALRAVLAEFIVQEQAAAPGALDGPQLIQLKWPNDIVCARGKLAGILVEAVQLTPARKVAIVGLGVNITPPTGLADDTARSHRSGASQDPAASHASAASHDPAAPIPAARAPLGPATPAPQSALAYLSQLTSPAPEPQRLAQSVLAGIIAQYRIWRSAGYRFAQFRQDFNANLALLDTEATVSNSRGEVLAEGIICGVDDDGCLLLADESDSLLHISTGEVTLRRQRA
jgi:biotin-(acetyl-CoA carboxylase) ligase